jgi:hypothetical protein
MNDNQIEHTKTDRLARELQFSDRGAGCIIVPIGWRRVGFGSLSEKCGSGGTAVGFTQLEINFANKDSWVKLYNEVDYLLLSLPLAYCRIGPPSEHPCPEAYDELCDEEAKP